MQIRRFVIGLMLIAAAVLLQIYLIKYNRNFKNLMLELTKNLPDKMEGLSFHFSKYMDTTNDYLKNVLNDYIINVSESPSEDDVPPEGIIVKNELIRNFRPPHLEYRIGDVILTRNMVVGAIIGWSIDMADLSEEPVYFLLAENLEQTIQENQDNMILLENFEIKNENLKKYFIRFDGLKYIPKQWLAKIYPKD